jgi:hypothetical protein
VKKTHALIAALVLIVFTLSVTLALKSKQEIPPTVPASSRIDNDVVVTLNSSAPFAEESPPTGKRGVICNLTVKNGNPSGQIEVLGFCIRMTASNQQIYSASQAMPFVGNYQKPIQATLLPGGSTSGEVVFHVDGDAQPVRFEFTDVLGGSTITPSQ